MISKSINNKISTGQVVLYRRVSTKKQARTEYRQQLRSIKMKYPGFSISKSTIADKSEVMSGRADPEKRMASGLGYCLRVLKQNPHAILLVSNDDRLARRADIFDLMLKQGVGQRVYEASTGMCLDDIIQAGIHRSIERRTEAHRVSRRTGIQKYLESGGSLGSPGIANHAGQATEKKKRLADARKAAVMSVVSRVTIQNRGQRPSFGAICDELDRREIRTGQGRFFTPNRLSQHRKRYPQEWDYAFNSYRRRRQRIRQLVTSVSRQFRDRRRRRQNMKKLAREGHYHLVQVGLRTESWRRSTPPPHGPIHQKPQRAIRRNGCRSPPTNNPPPQRLVNRQR